MSEIPMGSEIPMRPIIRRLRKLTSPFRGMGSQTAALSKRVSSALSRESRIIKGLKTDTEPKTNEPTPTLREEEGPQS